MPQRTLLILTFTGAPAARQCLKCVKLSPEKDVGIGLKS